MRKGIALLAVLLFLFFVVTIIAKFFDIYHKSVQTEALLPAQNSVVIEDTLSFLKSVTKEINSSEELWQLFTSLPVASKDGNFQALFTLTPLSNSVNVNLLNTTPVVESYLRNICTHYEIQDTELFIALLADTIDNDRIERLQESEISLYDPSFQNGAIFNFHHFKQILDYYKKFTNDDSIFAIPWESYIYFGPTKKIPLFCEFLQEDVARFLGLRTNLLYDCQKMREDPDNRAIMQKLDIISFSKRKPFWVTVDINYTLNDTNASVRIIYDINKNEELGIESYPTY